MKKITKTLKGNITNAQIGQIVKDFRTSRNMTLMDAQVETGFGNGFISQFERGKRGASLHTVIELCEKFGIEVEMKFSYPSK